jgi:hypothetical protein
MVEEIDYHINDFTRKNNGKVLNADVEYSTSLDTDLANITYGSQEGRSLKENNLGSDDLVYTVKCQSYQVKDTKEVMVPEHVAMGSVDGFVKNVLEKFTERDHASEWANDALKPL